MRGVGVALGPHRRVKLVQINTVSTDFGRVIDGFAVSETGILGKSKCGGVHHDWVALVEHGVDARGSPQRNRLRADSLGAPIPIDVGMVRTRTPSLKTLTTLVASSA